MSDLGSNSPDDPQGSAHKASAASRPWVHSVVTRLSRVIGRYPVWIVVAASLLAAIGGTLYAGHLKLVNDRDQMTDKNLSFNRDYRQYMETFGEDNKFLILVVRSTGDAPPDEPRREAMKIFARRWTEVLRQEPRLFPRVVERVDMDAMGDSGLLYLPFEDYQEVIKEAQAQLPRVKSFAAQPGLLNLMQELRAGVDGMEPDKTDKKQGEQLLDGLGQLFDWMAGGLAVDDPAAPDFDLQAQVRAQIADGGVDPDGFFFRDEGRVLLVFATIEGESNRQNRYEISMAHARHALKLARELVTDSAGVEGGMAGWPAMEYEEMETIQRDFTRGTLITLIFVSLLFMWGFRSLVRPAAAALCLGIAIGATFVFAYLVIGYLNMLAMIFAIILVALGIDFAIHFVTHYERGLKATQEPVAAVEHTFTRVGAAITVGGLTTVVAFLTMSFTEFIGLQELGIIAGGGLAICLLCIMVVYPAMLVLLDTRAPKLVEALQVGRENAATMRPPALNFEGRKPLAALTLGVAVLVAAVGYATGQYDFNTNVVNLLPVDGETLAWQQAVLDADDRVAFAISTTDSIDELKARQAAMEALPEVRSTESLLPLKLDARVDAAKPLCGELDKLSVGQAEAPAVASMRRQLYGLRSTLRTYREANAEADKALAPLQNKVEAVFKALGDLEPEVAERRLAALQGQLRGFSVAQLDGLRARLCPAPLTMETAPPLMRTRFVGSDGTLALLAYPVDGVWEAEGMARFVDALRTVDPDVFGGMVSYHENVAAIRRSFLQGVLYAMVAILIMVLLWSRSLRVTVLAVLPLTLGVGWLLGIMAWVPGQVLWNPANFFALPILIGVGVDSGVHIVEGWRDGESFAGAARAVLLSSLTTAIGFGVLATGDHRGTRSLGLVLFIGIVLILLLSLTVLPAALSLLLGRPGASTSSPGPVDDPT